MLQAQNVIKEIEDALRSSDIQTLSLITTDGIVLESREREAKPSELYTQDGENKDNFTVSSRMQTKIHAVFAAELWHQKAGAVWAGAETHDKRLVVHVLSNPDLLLLAVSDVDAPWKSIRSCAETLASNISKDI